MEEYKQMKIISELDEIKKKDAELKEREALLQKRELELSKEVVRSVPFSLRASSILPALTVFCCHLGFRMKKITTRRQLCCDGLRPAPPRKKVPAVGIRGHQ